MKHLKIWILQYSFCAKKRVNILLWYWFNFGNMFNVQSEISGKFIFEKDLVVVLMKSPLSRPLKLKTSMLIHSGLTDLDPYQDQFNCHTADPSKFNTQKIEILHSANRSSGLKSQKFCTQKMEFNQNHGKLAFPIFGRPFWTTAPNSKFCMKYHDHEILWGLLLYSIPLTHF